MKIIKKNYSEEYKNSQQNKEKESGGYFFGLFTRNVKVNRNSIR